MARQHDADLCDRIRALEKRVSELEAQQAAHQHCNHIVWRVEPQRWWQTPYITTTASGSTGIDSTAFTNYLRYDSSTGIA